MQVLDETIKEWASLKERNDTTFIASKLKMAPQNVSTIFRTGKGSIAQIAFIQKFYAERKKKVKQLKSLLEDHN